MLHFSNILNFKFFCMKWWCLSNLRSLWPSLDRNDVNVVRTYCGLLLKLKRIILPQKEILKHHGLPSEMPTSELPTSRQIWGRHYYNNSSSEMPTLVILLHFQMWMPSSSSMWLVGGQKLFSTTSNQPGVEWDKGFPTKYFFNTMYCTLQWWILNLVHMYFKKNIVTTAQEKN